MVNLGFTEQEKAILDKPFASGHPHVFLNKEDGICLEVEAWIKANRPHVLIVVARSANYTGVMDTGYGKMFLLDTNTGAQPRSSAEQRRVSGQRILRCEQLHFHQ